jgi:PncC family amidohydrolase
MPECEYKDLILIAEEKAEMLVEKLKKLSLRLVLAESCTAGLVSGFLANTSGASKVLWGSFVCYMQEAKVSMLGLNNEKLLQYGTVSYETVCLMAEKALINSGADIAAAVTGFAGQDGDKKAKGGTIWVATTAQNGKTKTKEFLFNGPRNTIRIHAAIAVFEAILFEISSGTDFVTGC